MIRALSISLFLLLNLLGTVKGQSVPKLEVRAGQVYVVGPDNRLIVDTLVLHNNAEIKFAANTTGTMVVKAAYVGDGCTITSRGSDGEHGKRNVPATNGGNGGDLELNIHFIKLGSLALDTRGGAGGKGYIGKNGSKPVTKKEATKVMGKDGNYSTVYHTTIVKTGSEGESGTAAGAGGSGGDLTLTYSTEGFVINFNRNARYSQKATRHINIMTQAGKTGIPGKDGRSYVGFQEEGAAVITGAPIPAPYQKQTDGQLKLINANKN
ncbi:hypothetical protein [Pontibacter pudoricolor]|uniref:hypothetical protein n=1 Tax=Pontibacter pudoricolor TaxID=2694930 RepID=UPI0013918AFD|nr:hypothetical protein [Pontibacter pudoricolor]